MDRRDIFSSVYSTFALLLFLFAFAVTAGAFLRSHWPFPHRPGTKIAGEWSVGKAGSGLAANWNFDAPLFHGARNITLEIEDGDERRKILLNRSGPTGKGEAEKTAVIRVGPKRSQAGVPDAPVSIWRVRAIAPRSITNRLGSGGTEVVVYVKIDSSGKVTAARTRQYDDATGIALAKLATEAALQWKFQPLKGISRTPFSGDFVIRFPFPKT